MLFSSYSFYRSFYYKFVIENAHNNLCLNRFRFSPLKPDQISSRLDQIVLSENVQATQCGKDALMKLAAGDMRRVLNLLQSTYMAYPIVNEENVYLTAGAALPTVIEGILRSLFNDTFEDSYKLLSGVSVSSFCYLSYELLINSFYSLLSRSRNLDMHCAIL